ALAVGRPGRLEFVSLARSQERHHAPGAWAGPDRSLVGKGKGGAVRRQARGDGPQRLRQQRPPPLHGLGPPAPDHRGKKDERGPEGGDQAPKHGSPPEKVASWPCE